MKKIDSIQVLRGIGAILILLFHLSFINRGEFAVDIFFCISGFILMYTTQKNTDYMLLKRLIRILPLYYIVTFIMFFIIKIIPSLALMSSANISYLIKSLFFVPYVSIGADSNNYVVPLVSIGWTLNLEMYFYLIFTVANKINNKNRGLITSIILIIIALLGFVVNCNNLIFKFITNSVILEFVLGIAFFYIYKNLENYNIKDNWKRIFLFLVSIGCLLLLWIINGTNLFAEIRILRYGILAYICFICFIFALKNIKIPNNLMFVGKISYSFYYVEFFTSAVVNKLIIANADALIIKLFSVIISVVITLIVSYISWFLVENKLGKFLSNKFLK